MARKRKNHRVAKSNEISVAIDTPIQPIKLDPSVMRVSLSWLRQRPLLVLFLVLGGMALLYIPALSSPPYSDDYYVIFGNENLKDFSNASKIVEHYFINRGLVQLSFLLDFYLFSGKIEGMHAISLFLHAIAVWLVWWFVRLVWDTFYPVRVNSAESNWTGLIACLFFGWHSINTEAINYLIARANIIATIFYLIGCIGTLWVLRSMRKDERAIVASLKILAISIICGICVGIGVGGKEIIVTLPLIALLLIALVNRARPLKDIAFRMVLFCMPIGLVVVAYLGYRYWFFGSLFGFPDMEARSPLTNFLTQSCVIVYYYLPRIFFPHNLLFSPNFPIVQNVTDVRFIGSFLLIIATFAIALWCVRKRPEITLGILWFYICLAPTSSFIPLWDIIAERRVYLPSIGIALVVESILMAGFLSSKSKYRRWAVAIGMILISWISYQTVARNLEYRNPVQFWYKEYVHSPNKLTPIHNLIGNLIQGGRKDEAIQLIRKIDLNLLADSNENISGDSLDFLLRVMLANQIEVERATRIAEEHVKLHPKQTVYWNTLQIAYLIQGKLDKATEAVENALKINARHALSLVNQAIIHHLLGKPEEAEKCLLRCIKYNPDEIVAYERLVELYRGMGKDTTKLQQKIEELRRQQQTEYSNTSVLEVDVKKN